MLRIVARCSRLVAVLLFVVAATHSRAAEGDQPAVADRPPPAVVAADHPQRVTKGLQLFTKHVRPVLLERCLTCHGGDVIEAEFNLATREGLLKGGVSGPAVVSGEAKKSLLYRLISHSQQPRMPYEEDQLPKEQIARIAEWIDHEAPYDAPLIEDPSAAVVRDWTQTTIEPAAREHWAYQPLSRVAPPDVENAAWCRTPVDRFVLSRLENAGIAPNAELDRRRLIRRAYFDLIGLPPTPDEVEAFVSDPAADACERLIDRLLDSPHYGERWGRHWLDLARFAESHGFEHDYDRPSAYHYRDFVIQALNDDLPYDTFVKWQLAGDEIAPQNNLALMATGFLAAGVHSTQITANEVEKHRYDEMDDMLATTGTAMLGLTIGCARCHDHKFDAFPQADYYRLLSTFTTTVRSEVELDFDPEGYRGAKEVFDREHAPLVAALKAFEAEQLPARLERWEATRSDDALPRWIAIGVEQMKSSGGTTLTKQDDGSVLASGENPTHDVYTFTARTDQVGITALRLEALADPSFPKRGPGRAANGNFALSDFRVTAAPVSGDGKPVDVTLQSAKATFEQKGLAVAAAIDGDALSAWAVDPEFGKDHVAVFETDGEVGFDGGTILTFTLKFQNNASHGLGRVRLSLSTLPGPVALDGAAAAPLVIKALQTPRTERTAEQTAALLEWYRHLDPQWQAFNAKVRQHLAHQPKPKLEKVLVSTEGLPPVRLHTQGADFFDETYFLRRGDVNQKQAVAPQGFLQVLLTPDSDDRQWKTPPPAGWRTSYRRTALAHWMTDTEHGAGHLLARVIVNRLWQHHLGRGIVATPSDFGTRGEPPSHPELLDYLAGELIRSGWRLKPIHKLIMTSSVYRQSGAPDEAKAKLDPDNRLFWRRDGGRLEGEIIRDALLSASGRLDTRMFGPGTLDEGMPRRSIYFTVKRSRMIPLLAVFDAPEPLVGVAERPSTTVAPQALALMNNPHVRSYARSSAQRLLPVAERSLSDAVIDAYQTALGRDPDAMELADGAAFVKRQQASHAAAEKAEARELALADFCQVLMCLNEFAYVE